MGLRLQAQQICGDRKQKSRMERSRAAILVFFIGIPLPNKIALLEKIIIHFPAITQENLVRVIRNFSETLKREVMKC